MQHIPRNVVLREALSTVRLLSSNAVAFFGILYCSLLARAISVPSIHHPLVLALQLSPAFLTTAYSFEICQQAVSYEEDVRNKPERPIPAGLITMNGAIRRWIASWTLSPLVVIAMGSSRAALHQILFLGWTLFVYVWPRPRGWVFKNLFTTIGTFFLLRMLNALMVMHASEASMNPVLDILFVAWTFITIHIQDFHDRDGDKSAGRRTLPVILQEPTLSYARRLTSALILLSCGTAWIFGLYISDKEMVRIFATLQFLGAGATSFRFLRAEDRKQAGTTYFWFYIPTGLIFGSYISLLNYVI